MKNANVLKEWWNFRVKTCCGRPVGRVLIFLLFLDVCLWTICLVPYAIATSRKEVQSQTDWDSWVLILEVTVVGILSLALCVCMALIFGINTGRARLLGLIAYPFLVLASLVVAVALAIAFAKMFDRLLATCSEGAGSLKGGAVPGSQDILGDADESTRRRMAEEGGERSIKEGNKVLCNEFAWRIESGKELNDLHIAGAALLGILFAPRILLYYTIFGYRKRERWTFVGTTTST